jgi:hypothetical protein
MGNKGLSPSEEEVVCELPAALMDDSIKALLLLLPCQMMLRMMCNGQ